MMKHYKQIVDGTMKFDDQLPAGLVSIPVFPFE